jgi:hypothetical protein
MHCFKKLKGCKKWDEVRLTLKETSYGEGPTPNTWPRPTGQSAT